MQAKYLIFDCVFNEQEMYILNKHKNILADCLIGLHSIGHSYKQLLYPRVELALLDLREIINQKQIVRAKWNSYVLAMLILKLEFTINMLEKLTDSNSCELMETISNSYYRLSELFDYKAAESRGDLHEPPLG